MAITTTQVNNQLVTQFASGSTKDTGTPGALTVVLGFMPRYFRIVNETTRVENEWFDGMAATYTLKTGANGTRTLDSGSGILVTPVTQVKANADDPTAPDFVASVIVAANLMAASDQIRWQAMA